jgi:ABC-type sugar transport system substrate-binding protein
MKKRVFLAGLLAVVLVLGTLVIFIRPTFAKQLEIAVMVPNGVDPYFTAKRYGYQTECEKCGLKMLFYDAGGYANVNKQIGQVDTHGLTPVALGN